MSNGQQGTSHRHYYYPSHAYDTLGMGGARNGLSTQSAIAVAQSTGEPYIVGEIPSSGFRCTEPNCNKIFQRSSDRDRHVRTIHGKMVYTCSICCRTFNRADNLRSHCRETHGSN